MQILMLRHPLILSIYTESFLKVFVPFFYLLVTCGPSMVTRVLFSQLMVFWTGELLLYSALRKSNSPQIILCLHWITNLHLKYNQLNY